MEIRPTDTPSRELLLVAAESEESVADYAGRSRCHAASRDDIKVHPAALYAGAYILYAEEKKVFSFEISDEILKELSEISEKYLLYHMERDFSSLIYLKKLLTDD